MQIQYKEKKKKRENEYNSYRLCLVAVNYAAYTCVCPRAPASIRIHTTALESITQIAARRERKQKGGDDE